MGVRTAGGYCGTVGSWLRFVVGLDTESQVVVHLGGIARAGLESVQEL